MKMRPVMAVAATLRLRRPRIAEDQVLSRHRDKTASVDTVMSCSFRELRKFELLKQLLSN